MCSLEAFELILLHLKKKNAYIILVGKRDGKRPLGRPRRNWEDNIRMDLEEMNWENVD
jgi:hypothetical protein